jgi:hypothetical protein
MRYEVIAPPSTQYPSIAVALCPPPAHNEAVGGPWWNNLIQANQGNIPVYSPAPGVHTECTDRRSQGSNNSPDYFYPSVQYALTDNCKKYVPTTSNNMMPVPATEIDALPHIAMMRPRVGGQNQVSQPSVTQSWPDLYAANNGRSPNGNAGWKD